MLPQKLEKQDVSGTNLSQNAINIKFYTDNEESVRVSANCSCSQCNSISCFKLRNQNSRSSCTCSLCEHPDNCVHSNKYLKNKKFDTKDMNKSAIKNEVDQIEEELLQKLDNDVNSDFDNRNYTKYSCKDVSVTKNKIDWNMKDKSYEKSSTRQYIHSVAVTYLPKERENSTAKLSAQIMNVPYEEFKDSLSIDNSHKNSSPIKFNDLVKSDFLTRLKEIYNECSCKICECITGKVLSNGTCGCKPCDCEKCIKTNFKYDIQAPHSGCPCVSCDRKDCRGVVKNDKEMINQRICDCSPCDCVKCGENLIKSCNCEPCQCEKCYALGISVPRTVIVAPVQGNYQHNICQCEPCDCVNCTHNYSEISSNLRRERSTGVISRGNCHCESCLDDTCQINSEACRCDIHNKVMKKPTERASRDYDIHRASVNWENDTNKFYNHDTIVTFALSSNTLNNKVPYSGCKCLECECLVCKEKKNLKEDNIKLDKEILNKYPNLSTGSFKACKCSPCECQICSKYNKQEKTSEISCSEITCGCNKCNCLVCKGLLHSIKNNTNYTKTTEHLFQQVNNNNISLEKSCVLKKGRLLTPSMFEAKSSFASELQNCILANNHDSKETKQKCDWNIESHKCFDRKSSRHHNVTFCQNESEDNNFVNIYDRKNKSLISEFPSKNIVSNKCRQIADIDLRHYKNNIVDNNFYKLKNIIRYSNENADNNGPNKTFDIFNSNKQKPIKDIELLEKLIYLVKSSSKTNVSLSKSNFGNDIIENRSYDRFSNIFQNIPKEEHNKKLSSAKITENIHFNEKRNSMNENYDCFKTLHSLDSRDITLCDKKSSFTQIVSKEYENKFIEINVTNNTNLSERFFEDLDKINAVDLITNKKNTNKESNEVINFKSNISNKDFKERKYNIVKSNKQPLKYHARKGSKCVGKVYNKLYSKVKRTKVEIENIDNKITYENETGPNAHNFSNDVITESNFFEGLEDLVKNKDSVLNTKDLIGVTSDKLLTSKILVNKIETDLQNDDPGDNDKARPIMRKNLYLSCSHICKNIGICTIPAMEDVKTNLKSIFTQTCECAYNIGNTKGKQALTRLHMEVNNLLNSPLLQSWHSYDKYSNIKIESNYLSQCQMDKGLKNFQIDATSQTPPNHGPVDKETNCNLIQSMENFQECVKNLMEMVLERAVYKSDLSTTKMNLANGYMNKMPKINSVKSSCHGLKAIFTGLKTISDHSVMVKWRLPLEVIHVQGYELQVDGRPVQKIFSPTRCMAVLTCLPHNEKLLFTIRTLTRSGILPSDHQPTSTIVYRSRVK